MMRRQSRKYRHLPNLKIIYEQEETMGKKDGGASEKDMVRQIIEHLANQQDQIDEIVVAHATHEGDCFLSLSCSGDLLRNMMRFFLQDETRDIKIPDSLNRLSS